LTADPDPFDNATKLGVTRALLYLRRQHADLFTEGAYRPLAARGERAEHVFAFARSRESQHVITIAGRLLSTLSAKSSVEWWADTTLELPPELEGITWRSVLSGQSVASSSLRVSALLSTLPTAVLAN